MADWFNITDTQVDPDAPLTSQLGYAWRDNPIAISEGAPGAPRNQMASLPRPASGSTLRHTSTKTTDAGGPTVSWSFPVIQFGSLKVVFLSRTGGAGNLIVKRRREDAETTIDASLPLGSDVAVSFIPGDIVIITLPHSATVGTATIEIRTGASDIIPIGGDWFGNYTPNAAP